jgi:hypothetical protein
MTADSLAGREIAGGHRPPLQLDGSRTIKRKFL